MAMTLFEELLIGMQQAIAHARGAGEARETTRSEAPEEEKGAGRAEE